MSAVAQTPGDRACRYARGAETVLMTFASEASLDADLAWGLHRLAEDAASALESAIEANDDDAIELVSLRYAQANAIIAAIAREVEKDLLLAGEALMEATKLMLDAEIKRRLSTRTLDVQAF